MTWPRSRRCPMRGASLSGLPAEAGGRGPAAGAPPTRGRCSIWFRPDRLVFGSDLAGASPLLANLCRLGRAAYRDHRARPPNFTTTPCSAPMRFFRSTRLSVARHPPPRFEEAILLAIIPDTPRQPASASRTREADTRRGRGPPALLRRIGICGTGLHMFTGNQPYLSYPRVMVHELPPHRGRGAG